MGLGSPLRPLPPEEKPSEPVETPPTSVPATTEPSLRPDTSGPSVTDGNDADNPLTRREKRDKREKELADAPALKRFWLAWVKPILIVVLIVTLVRSTFIDWNDVPSGSMNPTIVEGDRILINKMAYGLKPPLSHGIPLLVTSKNLQIYGPWTDKFLIAWGQPQRGDIVTFWHPTQGHRLVKRLVGVPGDEIHIQDGRLRIKPQGGEWVEAKYRELDIQPPPMTTLETKQGDVMLPVRRFEESILGHTRVVQHLRVNGQRGVRGVLNSNPQIRNFGPIVLEPGHYFMMGDNRDQSADSRFHGPVPRENITGEAVRVAWSLDSERYFAPRWSRMFKSLRHD